MGLGYPGGEKIDRASEKRGTPKPFLFPRSLLEPGSLDFSFSGLKTAVLHYVKDRSGDLSTQQVRDVAASFQEAVVDSLWAKVLRAADANPAEGDRGRGRGGLQFPVASQIPSAGGRPRAEGVFSVAPAVHGQCGHGGGIGVSFLQSGERASLYLNAYSRFQ